MDYFYRVEFQLRGSPHLHCLFWIKDAPVYLKELNNGQEVADFVDKYASCKKVLSLPYNLPLSLNERDKLIKRQTHKHTHTCYVKDPTKKICRFKFPKPPFDKTIFRARKSESNRGVGVGGVAL